MRKTTFMLLAAMALGVTSCKPKVVVTDASLEITNEYDAQVMNTLCSQFSTDSATMMGVIRNTLGYVEGIGTTSGGGHLCYRKGEMVGKTNQPRIHIHFDFKDCKKVEYVVYYSYSTTSIAGKSQLVTGLSETLTIADVSYKFEGATINQDWISNYQTMLSGLGNVSTYFDAEWEQNDDGSDVEMKVQNDSIKSRTELNFRIESPEAPK